MTAAIIAFAAVFLSSATLGVFLFGRRKKPRKIARMVSPDVEAGVIGGMKLSRGSRIEKLFAPFQQLLPRDPREVSTVQKRLARAGYRETSWINVFYASRVLIPCLLCVFATVTGAYESSPLFIFGLAAGLGFLAPDYWLSNRIAARQMKLRRGLPEALDLIIVCVEAGLTMDKATMRAAEELRNSQPAMADELNLVCLEQRAGRPRADAWRNLAERTGLDTIASVSSIVVQASKFGTSIGKTLRIFAETLRTRRRQEVEELAAKTTVKLVFPLVLLIFPSLFLVTLGPSVIVLMDGFREYFS